MNVYRYPLKSVVGDYARASAGLALTAGPAMMVPAGSASLYVLLPLAALFVAFAIRTGRRQIARVELTPSDLSIFGPGQVSLEAGEVDSVKLSYFSTKSDHAGGWMQLTLKGGAGRTIRIDSGLEGFGEIARWAAAAAIANQVELSHATIVNFGALGIVIDETTRP
ncbi:MAG TPA: hypothetical protein VLG66_12965 [Alphaproteobacteria bacterium]|nr:hypothetical protein [Alphaproteobacteria bacterium]